MNYLFFDIECSSHHGGISKICSFGYVLCDTDFNILEKKDIVINPVSPFSKEFTEENPDFFAYPTDYFYTQPNFKAVYPEIRSLLTNQNNIIIGHSTACDASYLTQNIDFYGLEHFDFTYLDTQKMHAFFTGESRLSLEKLCEIYGVSPLRTHKSDDDTEMTSSITKNIVEKYGLDPEDMLKNNALIGICRNGIVHDNLLSAFPLADDMLLTPSVKTMFRKYLSETVVQKFDVPEITGKKFIFDEVYEHRAFSKAMYVIDHLRECGGIYTVSSLEADVFVYCAERSPRGVRYRSALKQKKPIIYLSSLISRLNLDERSISGNIDTDAIFGNTEESKEWYEYYKSSFQNKDDL